MRAIGYVERADWSGGLKPVDCIPDSGIRWVANLEDTDGVRYVAQCLIVVQDLSKRIGIVRVAQRVE